ncbi:MAG: DUF5721 family protein [Lachnospira sp.]|nr:DUF5721 family protein [Lachnospira sp.]
MISLEVKNIRIFMSCLLMKRTFDRFYLAEASVSAFCNFEISGRTNAAWFSPSSASGTPRPADSPALAPYVTWEKIRPHVFQVIRGGRTPIKMKIILACTPAQIASILKSSPESASVSPDQVSGMFLNIVYDKSGLMLTTGTAMKTFSMDRSAEKAFDRSMASFLTQTGIDYDTSTRLN